MTCPVVTGWPGVTDRSEMRPARCACTSFSIFIASTMQTTWPAATSSPSATSTARTVPCIGLTTASLPPAAPPRARPRPPRRAAGALAAAARELGERRLRPEHADFEALAVDFDEANCWGQTPDGVRPLGV